MMFNYERFLKDKTINKKQLLLNNYTLINLNEAEVVILLLIQDMIDLDILVTNQTLSEKMKLSKERIDKILAKLIDKKYICYDCYSCTNNIDNNGVYQAVLKKIIQQDIEIKNKAESTSFEALKTLFEAEFNKKLSRLELEKLEFWYQNYAVEAIKNSLKEALFSNILTFKNIEKNLIGNK